MPLYEYQCSQCGRRTEKRQKFADAPLTECPHCGGPLKKLISAPAIQFKGGGWFADGYGSAKSGGSSNASAEGGSSSSASGDGAAAKSDSTSSSSGDTSSAKSTGSSGDSSSSSTAASTSSAGTSSAKSSSDK